MHFTLALLRKSHMPNGHIFRGKYRLVKEVTPLALAKLRAEYEQEIHNMNYLRFPYLTAEESSGHSAALGKQEKRIRQLQAETRAKFKPDVTYAERLSHMRVTEGWD